MEQHYAIPGSLLNEIMAFFATCRPHEVARMIVAIQGLKELPILQTEDNKGGDAAD